VTGARGLRHRTMGAHAAERDVERGPEVRAAPAVARPYLRVRGLTKRFGAFTALDEVSLDVHEGEFVCCLGPSGCGKTTLLRCIAGLDVQTSGRIEQAGRDISALAPAARDFGIVFQSYALFPNLTVFRNVAYGLQNRKMRREAIARRVRELLDLVGLKDQDGKYPAQLSGGQQQRVALARALATSPGLLLLDEPLSALDAKVRVRLRQEIRQLQHKLGVTTIMVTHDQEEALTVADRIVVMNAGAIDQVGTPVEIYRKPANRFVADFIGVMNFLPAVAVGPGRVRVAGVELAARDDLDALPAGAPVTVGIRPEDVAARGVTRATQNALEVTIQRLDFFGSFYRASLRPRPPSATEILADFSVNLVRELDLEQSQELVVALPEDRIRVFADPGGR
jgi:iron(III) transport system ATP-binding protein